MVPPDHVPMRPFTKARLPTFCCKSCFALCAPILDLQSKNLNSPADFSRGLGLGRTWHRTSRQRGPETHHARLGNREGRQQQRGQLGAAGALHWSPAIASSVLATSRMSGLNLRLSLPMPKVRSTWGSGSVATRLRADRLALVSAKCNLPDPIAALGTASWHSLCPKTSCTCASDRVSFTAGCR